MVMKYCSPENYSSEQRDDVHLPEFECGGRYFASQSGQIVFICVGHLLDKSMLSQAFEHSGYLMAGLGTQPLTQVPVLKSADIKLSANNGLEQVKIITMKEIEPSVATTTIVGRSGNPIQIANCRGGVIYRREELQVATVGCLHPFSQNSQAIDGFLQRGHFHIPGSVAVFHPSVVFEEGNIIRYGFDTKHQAVLVVHFNGHLTHVMPEAGPFHPGMEIVPHVVLVMAVELASQKRSNVLGFNRVNGGTNKFVIDRLEVLLLAKHQVGSIFYLQEAPVVTGGKMADHRTVLSYELIELAMEAFGRDRIRQCLSFVKVIDLDKGIVDHLKADPFFIETGRQLVLTIVIELQAERGPRGHPQIAQAQFRRNEVEVIMQTPAGDRLKIRGVGLFVMPGLIASTGLHRREDMDQTRMRASVSYNLMDPVFPAKVLLADELYFQAVLGGQAFGMGTDLVAQRRCPLGVVENPDVLCFEKAGHALGITNTGNGAGEHDAVKARQYPLNLTGVALNKMFHNWPFLQNYLYRYWSHCRAA
jgi:hypothetical protein